MTAVAVKRDYTFDFSKEFDLVHRKETSLMVQNCLSKSMTAVGAVLLLIPTPATIAVGVALVIAGAVMNFFGQLFNLEAQKLRKEAMEKFQNAIQEIKKEQIRVTQHIHHTILENQIHLEKISNTLKHMEVDVSDMEANIKNVTQFLTEYITRATEVTKSTMVFMEYRKKRDELDILHELLFRSLTVPLALKARDDFLYSCETRRPLLILNWIHRRVVSGKIEPSLMPSIVSYVDHNWIQFKSWKQIILFDAVKAIIFQHICQRFRGKELPDFLPKKDMAYGKQKLNEIEEKLNYYEELVIYKSFYNTTETIKKKLV